VCTFSRNASDFFLRPVMEIWCCHMKPHSVMSHVMSNRAADLWRGGRVECRILMLTTHLHPLQTPHSITYSRVMNGSVCCVIIYCHTQHMLIRQQRAFTRSGKTNEAANQSIRLRGTNKKPTFAELLTEE